jgi:hypothetical protein
LTDIATHYCDFQSQGSRIHTRRQEQFALGQHMGSSVIRSVEYPDTLPDSAFAPWTVTEARLQ